jgi:hypothetical protein
VVSCLSEIDAGRGGRVGKERLPFISVGADCNGHLTQAPLALVLPQWANESKTQQKCDINLFACMDGSSTTNVFNASNCPHNKAGAMAHIAMAASGVVEGRHGGMRLQRHHRKAAKIRGWTVDELRGSGN